MGPLRRVTDDGHMSVDQQIEPIDRLLDKRAPFKPNPAQIVAAAERLLHDIGDPRQCRHRRLVAEITGTVGKEIRAANFRWNVSLANVGSLTESASLGIAAGWQSSIKIEVRFRRKQTADAFVRNSQAIDLFEKTRSIRKERHPAKLRRRIFFGAVYFPRLSVGLAGHVGQRVETILRPECHCVDRFIVGTGWLFVERPG